MASTTTAVPGGGYSGRHAQRTSLGGPGRVLPILLTLCAIGVSIAAAVWLADLSHEISALRAARQHLREDGFVIIALFAVGVPVGTLLHTWPATAERQVRRAWLTAAGLMAYGVVVVAAAWLVAPLAPSLGSSRRDVHRRFRTAG